VKKASIKSRLRAEFPRIPYEHFDRTVRAMLMTKGSIVDMSDKSCPIRDGKLQDKTHAPGYQARAERLRSALAGLKPDDVDYLSYAFGNPPGFSDNETRARTRNTIAAMQKWCVRLTEKKQPCGAVAYTDWPMIAAVALWRRYEKKRLIGVADTAPFVQFARLFLEAMGLPHDGELRRRIETAKKHNHGFILPTMNRNPRK
jgi:hypothetical protein